jgi:DNA-binding transcriptional MerR regulator
MNANNPLLEDFATTHQLAELFNKSPRTIERWVRLRIIPKPKKIGRERYHHLPSVRKALTKEAA